MTTTWAFKSGDSQAVRIPAEIAYDDMTAALTITRTGDVITVYPTRGDLRRAVEILRHMPSPPEIEQREPIDLSERSLRDGQRVGGVAFRNASRCGGGR